MESLFRTELRVNEVLVAVEAYTFHHFHDGGESFSRAHCDWSEIYLRSMALSELLMFYRFWTMKDLWVEVPFYPLALLWLFALFASKMHSSPKLLKPYSFSFWQMEIMDLHPNTLLTCKNVSMTRMIVMSVCGQCVKSDLSKRECDANDNLDLRPGSSS